jgi:hypothetical protein
VRWIPATVVTFIASWLSYELVRDAAWVSPWPFVAVGAFACFAAISITVHVSRDLAAERVVAARRDLLRSSPPRGFPGVSTRVSPEAHSRPTC